MTGTVSAARRPAVWFIPLQCRGYSVLSVFMTAACVLVLLSQMRALTYHAIEVGRSKGEARAAGLNATVKAKVATEYVQRGVKVPAEWQALGLRDVASDDEDAPVFAYYGMDAVCPSKAERGNENETQSAGANVSSEKFERVIFPTVPRSGSHFVRSVVERVTGIATESVYGSEGFDAKFSNRTQAYGRCRQSFMPCEPGIRRGRGNEAVLIKTHFPYHFPRFDPAREQVDRVLVVARAPHTAFIAWIRASMKPELRKRENMAQLEEILHRSFEQFFDKWRRHHAFWIDIARKYCRPMLIVRYEDLARFKAHVMFAVLDFLPFNTSHFTPTRILHEIDRVPFIEHATLTFFNLTAEYSRLAPAPLHRKIAFAVHACGLSTMRKLSGICCAWHRVARCISRQPAEHGVHANEALKAQLELALVHDGSPAILWFTCRIRACAFSHSATLENETSFEDVQPSCMRTIMAIQRPRMG
ncbi:hypothetical protein FVE85_8683 [Porphyridium purpureum]|uniref:Sulfotransferase domain-containing protein n=1 Tax=Porphyridium purpureum TaxID=35688 RepID=A0A5J4YPK2_PORPP|nr:hypothetical protein FVE85_8683 [Porphyridium purpureum]|eukprot:POR4015..scf296_7